MAEEVGGKVLLFGGGWYDSAGNPQRSDRTYRWDGSSWSDVTPSTRPTQRFGGSMARVKSGVTWLVLLFGGGVTEDNLANDRTWFWNTSANSWTQFTSTSQPDKRQSLGMATTPPGQTSVTLFGGISEKNGGSFTVYRDTWLWLG